MTINGVYLSYNEMTKITETLESFFKSETGERMLKETRIVKEAKALKQ